MTAFTEVQPTLENYWRSVILFGRNVASYKFALGKSLIDFASQGTEVITLEQLAEPFSRHICEHLRLADKQTTSNSSRFLSSCRKFNAGEIKGEELLDATAKLGFNNVIDAFHIVHDGEIAVRFFTDERSGRENGILSLTWVSMFVSFQSLVEYPITLPHGFAVNLDHFVDTSVGRFLVAASQIPSNRNFVMAATLENCGITL